MQARAQAENALHFFPPQPTGWIPRAVTCSAATGAGINEVWEIVLEHSALLQSNGWFSRVRRQQVKRWMYEIIEQGLSRNFRSHAVIREQLAQVEQEVFEGRTTPFRAANCLLEIYTLKNA